MNLVESSISEIAENKVAVALPSKGHGEIIRFAAAENKVAVAPSISANSIKLYLNKNQD